MNRIARMFFAITLGVLVCGCGPVTVVSDVPCFTPEWGQGFTFFYFRSEFFEGGRILFTVQSLDQTEEDRLDETRDYVPHSAVYAFDPETEQLELVDSELWDESEGPVRRLSSFGGVTEFFMIQQGGVSGPRVVFEGAVVPIAGGQPISIIPAPAIDSRRPVAILSTSGTREFRLLDYDPANGQHYHQVFSEEDGRALGPAQRLGLGNGSDPIFVSFAWTADARYVFYRSGKTFCIADGLSP